MSWEVADIIRRAGDRFIERYHGSLTWAQLKVLRAIERCRTAALGGHRDQCVRCGHQAISYNSCLTGTDEPDQRSQHGTNGRGAIPLSQGMDWLFRKV